MNSMRGLHDLVPGLLDERLVSWTGGYRERAPLYF